MKPAAQELPLIERIERALVLLALFIELDGDVHVPMYEKFEAELTELQKKENTKDRARRLLLAYKRSGGRKAIASKSFNSSEGPLPYLGLSVLQLATLSTNLPPPSST
jgi:hypothetical protein